jgi:Secretion system C-terminal sorting domain
MSWIDTEPLPEEAYYRVRRECVDKRYEWLSDPSDAPVPALATLASAIAKPGQVDLSWYASWTTSAAVYRRTADTEWSSLGPASSSGDGLLTYTDRTVTTGRYAYRLGVDGQFTTVTWVDVPSGYTLDLEGFKPNPAVGALQIAFTLANDSRATLDVFAVNGRSVASRDVSSMGAGFHVLDLSREGMRPGVYWIRLTQAGRAISKKAVVAN